jgi:hypothetical protein
MISDKTGEGISEVHRRWFEDLMNTYDDAGYHSCSRLEGVLRHSRLREGGRIDVVSSGAGTGTMHARGTLAWQTGGGQRGQKTLNDATIHTPPSEEPVR